MGNVLEVKALTEDRAEIIKQINDLTATVQRDKRPMSPEEIDKFDTLEAQEQDLTRQLETARRLERSTELTQVKRDNRHEVKSYRPRDIITTQDRNNAFKAWSLNQSGNKQLITRSMAEAAEKCGVNPDQADYTIQRDQDVATAADGGNLTNDSLFQSLERNLKYFGGVRAASRVMRTETGETLHWAFGDDTANVAAIQSTENTSVSNTSVVYSRKSVSAFTFVSGVYPVSVQILQDARYDIGSDVGEVLGIRMGRGTAAKYSKGAGTTEPEGFTVSGTTGVTTASPTAITYGELVDHYHKLDPAYRNDPSCAWVMNDSTLAYLEKLTDQNSRPLIWSANDKLSSGFAPTLFGKPIVIDQSLDSIAASKKVIAFGAWSKFLIRDAGDIQLVVLRERYMDTLSVGYLAYMRTDCKLLNAKCIQNLLTHA